jgi:acyl carrier protein
MGWYNLCYRFTPVRRGLFYTRSPRSVLHPFAEVCFTPVRRGLRPRLSPRLRKTGTKLKPERGRELDTKEQIRQYLAQNFLFSNNGLDLSNDASFLEEGIVDSTGVLEMVMFVEETFNIEVNDDEIVPDNFDSVNALATFIARKRH